MLRVAYVSQPWTVLVPPVSQADSLAIWTYEVARRVARESHVLVYSRSAEGLARAEVADGVEYRRVRPVLDRAPGRVMRRILRAARFELPVVSTPYGLDYAIQVAREVARERPDIIHLQNFSQYAPILRWFNPRAKLILHMHCEWLTQMSSTRARRRILSTDRVVGCSSYVVEKIRNAFPDLRERCQVLHNGTEFPPQLNAAPPDRNPTILFVGRISPEKGVHDLIEAFVGLADRFPTARLQLVGPDAATPYSYIVGVSDEPAVRALARFYPGDYWATLRSLVPPHLSHRVEFTGAVDRARLGDHYRRATVLANPSLSESFGMTLLEAMSHRRAVVATRTGGMTDIVKEGETGLFVPAGDVTALKQALEGLLSDPARCSALGEAGFADLQRFSWDNIAADALRCYREMLTSP